MRMRLVASSLLLAVAASGCAGRRDAPCAPLCVTEVRRAPLCREVWIPQRTERRLAFDAVAPECRWREMPTFALCERVRREDRVTPVTTTVEVPELCATIVPTYETVCVPEIGHRPVQQYEDRIEPVCCPRFDPVFREVAVPQCGCVCDECGEAEYGTVGFRCEKRHAGYTCRMAKVGQRLTQVNVGERLEPYRTGGVDVACVPVGSRPAQAVVGTRYETVVVGEERQRVVVDRRVDAVEKGTRREAIVLRPCRLQGREEQVVVPGYCARVCDDPRHHHPGVVISSQEYTAITGKPIE
jgi:hypothetical protein